MTARRRRWLAIGAVCALAVGAFACGVVLPEGSQPRPSAASRLSLSQLAGERIVLGFPGVQPPAAVERMIHAGGVAGIVLFSDNLPSRDAGRRLIHRLRAIPRPPGLRDPLLTMVDQEGGLVKRIGGPPSASAEAMGARGATFSREQGRATAASLRDLGVNVDLAPVLDIARPGGTIAASDRGFGSSAADVAETAVPFAVALRDGGVAAAGKHFPGLGSARASTDEAVQSIPLSKPVLRDVDEAPFVRFFEAGGEMLMLSTAIYPAFSPRRAAFSAAIATGELRQRLGFEGVTITDALDTVAVNAFGGTAKVARAAVGAGVDLLLYTQPGEAATAHRALLRGLRTGAISRAAFEESAGRVLRLRHRLGRSSR